MRCGRSRRQLSLCELDAVDQSQKRRRWCAPGSDRVPHPVLAGGPSTVAVYFSRLPQCSYRMTSNNHGYVVAFSSKIAVKQSGDETGMSPNKPGIIVVVPVGLHTIGMHHQDASMHPGLDAYTNTGRARSERAIVAAEAFGCPIVEDAHRDVANSGDGDVLFRRTNLDNCPRRAASLGQSLIDQLQCRRHSRRRLRAKDGNG